MESVRWYKMMLLVFDELDQASSVINPSQPWPMHFEDNVLDEEYSMEPCNSYHNHTHLASVSDIASRAHDFWPGRLLMWLADDLGTI
jgi:hypothetical protein